MSPPKSPQQQRLLDRVLAEGLQSQRALFDSLADSEKALVLEWLGEAIVTGSAKNPLHDALWEIDFIRKPVSPEQFMKDEYYLGSSLDNLYPKWLEVLKYVLDPKNNVSELILTGAIGTGKCVSKRTLVSTGAGLLKMSEVYEARPESVLTASNTLKPISAFHDEGETETLLVQTKHGHRIEGRPNHRVLVLDYETCTPRWCSLDALSPGDVVLQSPAPAGVRVVPLPLAELCGWYVAEGSWAGRKVVLSVHQAEVPALGGLIRAALGMECVAKPDPCGTLGAKFILTPPENLLEFFPPARSQTHEIPRVIREGTRAVWAAFLRGWFSGDGTVDRGVPSVTSASAELIHQARALMTSMGYYVSVTTSCSAYRDKDGGRVECSDRWVLRVVGLASRMRFVQEIGFFQPEKMALVATEDSRNADHSFAFTANHALIRDTQPKLRKGQARALGLSKKTSPAGLVRSLRTQAATLTLLRTIRERGGVLPGVLGDIVDGRYLFDVVESITPSRAHCYDLSVSPADPSYVAGGFINHNTYVSCAALAYKMYWLSCMRNPAKYYGLSSNSKIVYGFYALTKKQAHDVGYYKLRTFIANSPYFKKEFPFNPRLETTTLFTKHPIAVIYGSKSMHAIGSDLISLVLDEGNFFASQKKGDTSVDLAKELYDSATSRLLSRYMRPGGTLPGLVVLPSSRNGVNSFVEQQIEKKKNNKSVFIADYSLWEMKGAHLYFLPKVRVQVGNKMYPSKVLADPPAFDLIGRYKEGALGEADVKKAIAKLDSSQREPAAKDARVVEVPGEFLSQFLEDTDQALRDIAGVATFNVSPFIRDRTALYECVTSKTSHPFGREWYTVDIADDFLLQEGFNLEQTTVVRNGVYTPKRNPSANRYLHFDLSLSGDCVGIAMCHISHIVRIKRVNQDGTVSVVKHPYVLYDFMLQVRPPQGSEIEHAKLRSFVMFLKDIYAIKSVTFDGYMSPPSIQILRKSGLNARILSVDTSEDPYLALRSAIYERRVGYYDYAPFMRECLDLVRDVKREKIDHPVKGTDGAKGAKDVSDAASGSLYACLNDLDEVSAALDISGVQDLAQVIRPPSDTPSGGTFTATKENRSTRSLPPESPPPVVAGVRVSTLEDNL